ncbi:MAG: hypothetical protein AB7N80_02155 [Bdellovibrionales bacterium]
MRAQPLMLSSLLSLLLTLSFTAEAAKVSKVDGRKVMIDLEGDSANAGDVFVVMDPNGKRKGLVKIRAVKGNRAVGLLGKGKAEAGWATKFSSAGKSKSASGQAKTSGSPIETPTGTSFWGLIGGFSMNSMKVKVDNDGDNTNETSVSLSGNAFSLKGLFDYNMFSQIWFRGMLGLEGLSAKGPTQVGCQNKACDANIYYLSADFWARFLFSQSGSFRPWAGGAFSLMFPASKKATALEEKSITNTSAISLGGGFDWFTSPTFAIPVQVEYSLLPKSETVEATVIAIRAGVMFTF